MKFRFKTFEKSTFFCVSQIPFYISTDTYGGRNFFLSEIRWVSSQRYSSCRDEQRLNTHFWEIRNVEKVFPGKTSFGPLKGKICIKWAITKKQKRKMEIGRYLSLRFEVRKVPVNFHKIWIKLKNRKWVLSDNLVIWKFYKN